MSTRDIVRKKNTGEPVTRSGGEFGTVTRGESSMSLGDAPAETVFTKRYDSLDEKISAFKDELVKGVDALADDHEWHEFLDTMGKFHNYSFQNQILIRLQRPNATRVAGFKQWKSLERNVVKGEKGLSILAPKIANIPVKDKDGNPKKDADGKPIKERRCIGFTTASVFDVSQTDGKPLPEAQHQLTEDPPAGYVDDLTSAIEDEGFTVTYADIHGSANGYTDPHTKSVVIDPNASPANQAKTLAHELGHIKAGHLDRMDEYHTGQDGCRGEMEVEAESIAYVLSRANGMSVELNQNTSRYLNSWSAQGTTDDALDAHRKAISSSGETVAKTVKALLTERTWQNA